MATSKTLSICGPSDEGPKIDSSQWSFLDLPGEIRNQIYTLLLTDPRTSSQITHDFKPPHRRQKYLCPAFLRTCRQIYNESVKYLYACNEFLVSISPEMGCLPTFKGAGLPPLSHPRLGLIKRLGLRIYHDFSGLRAEDECQKLETHLRSLVMGLLAKPVRLAEMVLILGCGDLRLSHNSRLPLDLLRPLKELRVSGKFEITRQSKDFTDERSMRYLGDVESIVRGAGCAELDIPVGEVSTRWEMYRDLVDTVRGFRGAAMNVEDEEVELRMLIAHAKFWEKLSRISDMLGLRQAPPNREDVERLEKIDMPAVLGALEEAWNSIPVFEDWGTTDERDFEEVAWVGAHEGFKKELGYWRDLLYLRQEFQDMGPEGTPAVRRWVDVEVGA